MNTFKLLVIGLFLIVSACTTVPEPPVVILPTSTIVLQPATPTPTIAPRLPAQDVEIPDFEKFPNLVEVDFWHPWSGEKVKVIEELVSGFNLSNPWNIKVNAFQKGDEDYLARNVILSLDQDDQPNVIAAPIGFLRSLLLSEKDVLDLSPYVSHAKWGITTQEQLLYPVTFWQQDVVEDFRFGLPAQRNAYFLFYNKTWAQELGFASPPSTPDEFLNQSCAAARNNSFDKDPGNDGTGGWIFDPQSAMVLSWMRAFGGGQMPDAESGSYLLQNNANERAFTFLQRMMRLGCAWVSLEKNQHLYFSGRKALFYSGSMEDILQQKITGMKDNWMIIPYPSLTGDEIILSEGLSYGIFHKDSNRDLASWLFIRWLQKAENLARMIATNLTYPLLSSVGEELKKIDSLDPTWEQSLQYLPLVKSMPLIGTWLDVGKVLQDAAWQVVQSNIKPGDVNTILADAETLIKEILSQ